MIIIKNDVSWYCFSEFSLSGTEKQIRVIKMEIGWRWKEKGNSERGMFPLVNDSVPLHGSRSIIGTRDHNPYRFRSAQSRQTTEDGFLRLVDEMLSGCYISLLLNRMYLRTCINVVFTIHISLYICQRNGEGLGRPVYPIFIWKWIWEILEKQWESIMIRNLCQYSILIETES